MNKLRFSDVSMAYGSSSKDSKTTVALEDLSLEVEDGQSIAIIGPSGCGKSTLLKLACGLVSPTAGSVCIDGLSLDRPRRETSLVLQDFGLLPWKTVIQNAELGLLVQKMPKAQRREMAAQALETVGLADFASSFPNELSGGMQQRLALARAIAGGSDLLLLDEPLSALDFLLREELQNLLLQLWADRGYTQILVTHSIEEAVFLGQCIIVMCPRPGRIVATIDNPKMGDLSYRKTEEFSMKCREIRESLATRSFAK